MTFRTWNLAAAVAMVALTGCAGLQTADESTTTEELSVLNWSADFLTAGVIAAAEPALTGISNYALAVYPTPNSSGPQYMHWALNSSDGFFVDQGQMNPLASSTAKPTLVTFNGFAYLFYASGVDQYYARFNPANFTWTGSALLPFTSLGAVAAIPYNGSLAILRVDPSTQQLMMRTMNTAEVFSAEQAVAYNPLVAKDPCQPPVITTAAAGAAPAAAGNLIGGIVHETTSSTPALAVSGTCLYLAHLNGSSNTLVYNTFANGSWGPARTVTGGAGGTALTSAVQPAMANFAGVVQLVYVGGGGSFGDLLWTTYDGSSWAGPLGIPNHQSQGTPSLAPAFNKLLMLHQGVVDSGENLYWSQYTP